MGLLPKDQRGGSPKEVSLKPHPYIRPGPLTPTQSRPHTVTRVSGSEGKFVSANLKQF